VYACARKIVLVWGSGQGTIWSGLRFTSPFPDLLASNVALVLCGIVSSFHCLLVYRAYLIGICLARLSCACPRFFNSVKNRNLTHHLTHYHAFLLARTVRTLVDLQSTEPELSCSYDQHPCCTSIITHLITNVKCMEISITPYTGSLNARSTDHPRSLILHQ